MIEHMTKFVYFQTAAFTLRHNLFLTEEKYYTKLLVKMNKIIS